jgi:hypothetical protein
VKIEKKVAPTRSSTPEPKQIRSYEPDASLISASPQDSSKILHAIGTVKFERRTDGSFLVRYPVQGKAYFGPNEEVQARELFQSVARAEKGYASGFDPRGKRKLFPRGSQGP